jgi:hypothetical protein
MKKCPACERDLPLDAFSVDRSRKSGRTSRCRECNSKQNRAWYAANKDHKAAYYQANREEILRYYRDNRTRISATRRNHRYSMTDGEWDSLFIAQCGCCYLCGDPLPEDPAFVATDHDHSCCPGSRSCGRCVRGLACVPCNTLIARANDDPERLLRIAVNLERAQASLVAA